MQTTQTEQGKGYAVAVSYAEDSPFIHGAMHIEMSTQDWLYDDDKTAAKAAERDGLKLVYGMPYVEDGVYLDTAENRLILENYSRKIQAAMRKRAA